jgi:hypothetical protein
MTPEKYNLSLRGCEGDKIAMYLRTGIRRIGAKGGEIENLRLSCDRAISRLSRVHKYARGRRPFLFSPVPTCRARAASPRRWAADEGESGRGGGCAEAAAASMACGARCSGGIMIYISGAKRPIVRGSL